VFDQFDQQPVAKPEATFMDSVVQGKDSMKAGEMLSLNEGYKQSLPQLEKLTAEAGNPVTRWFYGSQRDLAKSGIEQSQRWLAENQVRQQAAPRNPAFEEFNNAKTFGDAVGVLAEHPAAGRCDEAWLG
jgi:hypothetical protein